MYIISSYTWRSPYTLNIENSIGSFQTIVKPLGKAIMEQNEIILDDNLRILLSEAKIYHGLEKKPGFKPLAMKEVFKLLSYYKALATAWPDFYESFEYKRICSTLKKHHPLSRDALSSIIGLGRGFTPSGDDFISGYLGALYYHVKNVGPRVRNFSIPNDILMKTTWASRNYIIYSIKGLIDELGEFTLHNMFNGDINAVFDSIIYYGRRGHESGLYIWLGLITGFSETIHNDVKATINNVCTEA